MKRQASKSKGLQAILRSLVGLLAVASLVLVACSNVDETLDLRPLDFPVKPSGGVADEPEAFDGFGRTQVTGDFNGDGLMDLAVGVPDEDLNYAGSNVVNAGAVNVFYGSANADGLTTSSDHLLQLEAGTADSYFGSALASGDFDNDGHDDLAVGAPNAEVSSFNSAGTVTVFYGTSTGLYGNTQELYQGAAMAGGVILGVSEHVDGFGRALASGDFDGDGHDDLAIGVPGDNGGGGTIYDEENGAVNVLYGANSGLRATGNQLWTQDSAIEGSASDLEWFGSALAAGDFDGDGRDDLAIGVPGEYFDAGGFDYAGAVNVLYGTNSGLSAVDNQLWSQDTPGIRGVPENGDHFGQALAAADFDNDGRDDLAIGVPYEDLGSGGNITAAGAVNVLYGTNNGLSAVDDQIWHQNNGLEGVSEMGDLFGSSLTTGYFNNDNRADLAIGVGGERIGADNDDHGAVNVLYGSGSGLSASGNRVWYEDLPEVPDSSEPDDRYGRSLTAGDFNGDGFDELSVGVPGQEINGFGNAGAVNILSGSNSGLTATPNQYLSQD